MKFIFFGNHIYGHHSLQALLRAGLRPSLVVTNIPHSNENIWYPSVAELAVQHGIDVERINIVSGVEAFREMILKLKPDLFIVSSFRNILDKKLLSLPKLGAINLHMSLLPKYRGPHPENWAIINNEKTVGFTVHYIDEGIDTGDIIVQSEIAILPEDDILTLTFKLAEKAPELLVKVLKDFEMFKLQCKPQNESMKSFFPPRKQEDGLIDWKKKSIEIYNLVRALARPYPGAFTFIKGKKVTILRTKQIISDKEEFDCGKIVGVSGEGITVGTGDGKILIREWCCDEGTFPDNSKGLNFDKIR